MAVVELTSQLFSERLEECRTTYKLNVGYAALTTLPSGFVEQVKKYNTHLLELELSSNQLTDLPSDLSELQHLRVIRLKYNSLVKLPDVLTRLPRLEILELSGNQITSLDDAVLCHLQNVRELDLSGNNLTDLGEGLTLMPNLAMLQLENNRIEALPEAMGNCRSLIKLDVSTNNLRHLPDSMAKLRKIQRLDCANNMLRRVPPAMGNLKTLKEFDLRYNNLDEPYKLKSEEGLSRLLAFLREEEERERLEEIERLKPVGAVVGSYTEYRCKAEPAQLVKLEDGSQRVVDNRCWIRSGHSMTQAGSLLYCFGGLLLRDGTKSNECYWMTTDRMEWHLQPTTGDKPAPRDGHSAVFDDTNNRLVVFGGRNQDRRRLGDVYYLDIATWTWHKADLEGGGPSPRAEAGAVHLEGHMYVFGGHGAGARLNDLHVLDLATWRWEQPTTSGTAPSPRQAPALALQGPQLYVHGGRNNFVLEDLWVLDLLTKEWSEVLASGSTPPARHGHIATVHADSLYLYGGYDDLGGYSDTLYTLPLSYGMPLASARRCWTELISELQYNCCRSATFHNGQLSIYQVGSPSLGFGLSDDSEKGMVAWDVFKCAKLADLKVAEVDEEASRAQNAKLLHITHCMTSMASKLPHSYTTNSPKELRMLEYLDQYTHMFKELYPQRRPLFITPKNECGMRKFVCTTLRPTQLPFTEFTELDGIIQAMADYLAFEPLDNPVHMPEYLPSPTSVINWQGGDSFDMANVLCSLLLGAGYDAYVAVGYAPLAITSNDQSQACCPALQPVHPTLASSMAVGASTSKKEDKSKACKYTIKNTAKLQSAFWQAMQTNGKENMPQRPAGMVPETGPPASVHAASDSTKRNLVHAWVVILAGKREVAEHLMIEPSTGRQYAVASAPYYGIEFMWNHQNYWVCMQMPEQHSDSRADPCHISYDLIDTTKWERVLEDSLQQFRHSDDFDVDSERSGASEAGPGSLMHTGRSMSSMPKSPGSVLAKAATPRSAGGRSEQGRRPTSSASTLAGADGKPASARASAAYATESVASDGCSEGEEMYVEEGHVPDMPPSWLPRILLARDMLDMRCPKGAKTTAYHRCQHEIFALFGECSRWDGMVERLQVYEDDARSVIGETLERYQRRRDRLRERRILPQQDSVQESFDPGASFGLKELLVVKGERRRMTFYPAARLDGLVCREEQIGSCMNESFTGRDDRLIQRSVRYGSLPAANGGSNDRELRGRGKVRGEDAARPVLKLTEVYARQPGRQVEEDVAKRTFLVDCGQIRLDFHYDTEQISHSSRVFTREGLRQLVQVDPLAQPPAPAALLEEYQRWAAAEKECLQSVRESEREVKEVLSTRERQEKEIKLVTPYYDIVRETGGDSDDEVEEEEATEANYLTPFLPPGAPAQVLTQQEALEVREKCLKALKDRLVERANIIQARHDEERATLNKRQANFQRDRDQMTREEEEEYERACEESMFRIHILDKRLKRHEEQALQKYYELDNKLRHDARLAILKTE
ncbi:hypothetical protein WJX72_010643 [[Myrmecia] bisecta]|uniref:Uncharacterized protein n=1 Tax=[Myrmecia] bisecta TaxID=41462 RepID=A0AAW1PV69_9CHLO